MSWIWSHFGKRSDSRQGRTLVGHAETQGEDNSQITRKYTRSDKVVVIQQQVAVESEMKTGANNDLKSAKSKHGYV